MSKKTLNNKSSDNTELSSLDELIINMGLEKNLRPDKYRKLVIAMRWAYHLKTTEEWKDKPSTEIIEKAMIDVFSGKVDQKKVDEALEKDEEKRLEKMAERKKEKSS